MKMLVCTLLFVLTGCAEVLSYKGKAIGFGQGGLVVTFEVTGGRYGLNRVAHNPKNIPIQLGKTYTVVIEEGFGEEDIVSVEEVK